jgi:hypothetical protein
MSQPNLNALDVLKLTARDNCGQCAVPNCMAFCALVVRGQKDPADCPHLGPDLIERLRGATVAPVLDQRGRPESLLEQLLKRMGEVDFEQAAPRLGAWIENDRLVLHCLGKVFELDRRGGLHSMCHVNPWIHLAILQSVVHGQGLDPQGRWSAFRELKEARDWERFFSYRCESSFHQMADADPCLFLDVLELFGRELEGAGPEFEHAVILHPLPKAPFLFCYTPAADGIESCFSLLFDRTIEMNLRAEGTYMLAQGIVEMFKKILARHGA